MKKGDLIIVVAILVLASAALVGKFIIGESADEKRLIITKNHVVLHDLPLESDSNYEYRVGTDGEYNIITVENGVVNITEANCRNQICVNDGKISKVGEILVCLPHKLTVEIKGEKSEDIDVISE